MRNDFIAALKNHQPKFGLELPDDAIERLADYYALILEHNPIMHLVGPCSPEEFANRHILESLTLLEYLPENTRFADVGAGAGLPSIPCLLVREDLKAILIESKEKKSKFLKMTVESLKLKYRTRIAVQQFQEADLAHTQAVTCRALDKFTEKLPGLIRWSAGTKLLLFGGDNLRTALQTAKMRFDEKLMPMSEKRFLFVIAR
ncbi:MAG: RsmG family class I SAM-dependent methyltransferase [Pyrinomonadaceae bacterium]